MYYSGILIGSINVDKLAIYLPYNKVHNKQPIKTKFYHPGGPITDIGKIREIHKKLIAQNASPEILQMSSTCINWLKRIKKLTGYCDGYFFFEGLIQIDKTLYDIVFIILKENQTIVMTKNDRLILAGNILKKLTLFTQKNRNDYRYLKRVREIKKTLYIALRNLKMPKMLIKYLFESFLSARTSPC